MPRRGGLHGNAPDEAAAALLLVMIEADGAVGTDGAPRDRDDRGESPCIPSKVWSPWEGLIYPAKPR